MWSPIVSSVDEKAGPVSRCKHGAVLQGVHVYLLGGRNGNLALKDFWRYHIEDNVWEQLKAGGETPGCLQEHSMVGYNGYIYVFGGEISFSNAAETPLWIYNIQENTWRKYIAPKGVVTPKGRRSHTAIVFQDSMYIYGGYQDLRGSTSELWAFHFSSETWHLVSQGGSVDGPPARHRHSAVLHDSAMWVFGGMTDLQERADFWKFDFISRMWRPVRSKPGPGCLHSHAGVKFLNSLLLFGGEREGQTLNELWKFHFATEYWEKLTPATIKPQPRAQTIAFVFSQFRCGGEVRYMGRPEQDYFGVPLTPNLSRIRPMARLREEAETILDSRHEGRKYTFLAPDSCSEDEQENLPGRNPLQERSNIQEEGNQFTRISKDLYRDLKRPQQFQRLEQTRQNTSKLNSLARVSQLNLTRFSQYCSYSMFNNESTESLESGTGSPCSVRLSISSTRLNQDKDGCLLPRDQLSVPNFASLQAQAQEEEELEELENSACFIPAGEIKLERGATRSDSEFTFQSYDCSSRSSTLPSSRNLDSTRLIDLEETGDEDSSVSGYDSLEAVNLSFSNPHYMRPNLTSLQNNKDDDIHSRFAEALKSPTTGDSSSCQVELRTRPKSEFVERPENPSFRTRPLSHLEQSVRDKVGLKTVENRVSPVADQGWEQSELQLHMYIVGGREVGQVTVFRRPLSIWKLDLTKL